MTSKTKSSGKFSFFWTWIFPIVLALGLAIGTEEIYEYITGNRYGSLLDITIYLAYYFLIVFIIGKLRNKNKEPATPHPAMNWPMSGPIGKLGHYVYVFTFLPTSLLTIFNPWLFWQQIKQMAGMSKIAKRCNAHESQFENYKTKVEYQYPFDGQWLIFNGGYSKNTSHSWDVLTQRYAFDFVIADEQYSRHANKGNRLTDYHCYDQPILAAADGEVVVVRDGINPAPLVGYGIADFLCRDIAGNHVIIKHAEGEYGFYAHLVKGSLKVQVGDRVTQGQQIGSCGHTGMSSEPHLHFHLQDKEDFFTGMGLPIKFNNQTIERGRFVSNYG